MRAHRYGFTFNQKEVEVIREAVSRLADSLATDSGQNEHPSKAIAARIGGKMLHRLADAKAHTTITVPSAA